MISHISEESIATAPPTTEAQPKQSPRPRKLSGQTFNFFWRRGSRDRKEDIQSKKEDSVDVKILDCKPNNAPPTKMSFDFFRNIKKHMHIKSLTMCKSKQRSKQIETSGPLNSTSNDLTVHSDKLPVTCETFTTEQKYDSSADSIVSCDKEASDSPEISSTDNCISQAADEISEYTYNNELRNVETINAQSTDEISGTEDDKCEAAPVELQSRSSDKTQELQQNVPTDNNVTESQTEISTEITRIHPEISDSVTSDNRVKASLTEELLKLSKYGWYWGPISGDEADAKLISEPDGAFLVRDSSDDRYVLTLSFKSSGKLLHARMEHSGGLFSLCNQSESEGFTSVAALINHSMDFSQSAVFCYSRPKYPGYPSFPVRLTKPVSRFTQVRSLQYLCRFVIRQNTRLDNIHKLPLPKTIKGYIEEAHY